MIVYEKVLTFTASGLLALPSIPQTGATPPGKGTNIYAGLEDEDGIIKGNTTDTQHPECSVDVDWLTTNLGTPDAENWGMHIYVIAGENTGQPRTGNIYLKYDGETSDICLPVL